MKFVSGLSKAAALESLPKLSPSKFYRRKDDTSSVETNSSIDSAKVNTTPVNHGSAKKLSPSNLPSKLLRATQKKLEETSIFHTDEDSDSDDNELIDISEREETGKEKPLHTPCNKADIEKCRSKSCVWCCLGLQQTPEGGIGVVNLPSEEDDEDNDIDILSVEDLRGKKDKKPVLEEDTEVQESARLKGSRRRIPSPKQLDRRFRAIRKEADDEDDDESWTSDCHSEPTTSTYNSSPAETKTSNKRPVEDGEYGDGIPARVKRLRASRPKQAPKYYPARTKVYKTFGKEGSYWGMITKSEFDPQTESHYYKIQYTDGDDEIVIVEEPDSAILLQELHEAVQAATEKAHDVE